MPVAGSWSRVHACVTYSLPCDFVCVCVPAVGRAACLLNVRDQELAIGDGVFSDLQIMRAEGI